MQRRQAGMALALTVAVIAGLAGCAPGDGPDDAGVITVWAHHGRELENAAMRRMATAFNKAHQARNLRIEIHFFPDRQYADKVSVASASGRLPDVLDIDGPYVGPWAAEGLLKPIDEFVTADLRADFLPSVLKQGTFDGRLYGLGAFDSALVVYYNRDFIEAAGLQPPGRVREAWTWNQFTDALRRVQPHAAIPLSLHMDERSDEWLTYAFSPLIWSNGGRLIDVEKNRVVGVLNSPQVIEAVRRWQDLFKRGLAEATTTHPNPFADGLAAFDWTGHWMLPSFEAADGLRFGVMPLPRMGGDPVCASGSWCWGISRDCKNPSAAWQVVAWFVDSEHGVVPMAKANGAVPSRRSAFRFFPEYDEMPRRLFREQLETAARPRPRTAVYLSLSGEFARALRDIALGAEVTATLTKAAESVQRTLDRRRD